ncbi:hypothetical protein RHGRI_019982 [Rhododendron griersonianum]|uniref:Uncharacterized protein n=1 Tax=Rhododendron griersonianum TaxID=479676 RepID=A0AAV6JJA9_9ERIC|nr:hypothetical protein RHGRI_019982 [Rhododendron griersonianum]
MLVFPEEEAMMLLVIVCLSPSDFGLFIKEIATPMRGTASFLSARNIFKQICPAKGAWGTVATSTPKKQTSNDIGAAEGKRITNDRVDPIVAFSKPPPLLPVLGPFVALSVVESWYSDDG